MPDPLDGLNPQQQEAVEHLEGPLCVFAGPGSGKTHTLIRRIGCLIWLGVDPSQIMAITFTRKAADELERRLADLDDLDDTDRVYANTFHAFCREELSQYFDFNIADEDKQISIIESLPAAANNPDVNSRNIKLEIQNYKLALTNPDAAEPDPAWIRDWHDPYQAALVDENMLDFADLLMKAITVFQECPNVIERLHERFRYIHVDEFQDMNWAQGRLATLLAGPSQNICVVGDDDQSIYGFQGAYPDNIRAFNIQFPDAEIMRLNQNYRSTRTIVEASRRVIERNNNRIPKNLFTENHDGRLIKIIHSDDETNEARKIANVIQFLIENPSCLLIENPNLEYRDIAVLFRNRWVGDNMVEELRRGQIPFNMRRSGALGRRELLGDLNYVVPDRDEVALSTVHGAKGLEYKVVFMIGLEEGIFPDYRNCLEEERRLFYVGMTRAERLLYLSYVSRRGRRERAPSTFLNEVPHALTR